MIKLLLLLGILGILAMVTVGVIILVVMLSKNRKLSAPTPASANQPPILRS